MHPWMLQGLAIGCLLTATAAVVQKETSKAPLCSTVTDGRSHLEASGRSHSGSASTRLPSKVRGSRKDESYASRIQTRIDERDYVTVGGQVNSPGPVPLGPSSTLQSVIEKAGGATPFGALRRVRLTRGIHVIEYDLTTADGSGIPVQPKDTVEVPQKMVVGN
jgi:protein involved in polysaccharide export with SLBB domain